MKLSMSLKSTILAFSCICYGFLLSQSAYSQAVNVDASRAYLCFYVSHLTLEGYQRAGFISGYSIGAEPVMNRSHPEVSSGIFPDTLRHWAWQTNVFNFKKMYNADPDFTETKYSQALSPFVNASNRQNAITTTYMSCKDEWLDQQINRAR